MADFEDLEGTIQNIIGNWGIEPNWYAKYTIN